MRRLVLTMLAVLILVCASRAAMAGILVSDSGGTFGYGYGYSQWTNFTAALNSASGNSVTVASNFGNLAQMLSFDALFLDQRWTGGSLSATEISNLQSFIATGRRVVMIGENSNWTSWNQQILGIVGGTYSGAEVSGTATAVVSNSLTVGASTVSVPAAGDAGVAVGGTALYNLNFATLWGANQNVLTVLDVNVWSNGFDSQLGNAEFGQNVAQWLAAPVQNQTVPEPSTLIIFGAGSAMGLAVSAFRRRQMLPGGL